MQAAKDVQATVGKLQSKADSLKELGSQKLNSQQRQAVASVLVGAGGGTLPLALFGPPGTGKTVTLVECALQVTISTFLSEQESLEVDYSNLLYRLQRLSKPTTVTTSGFCDKS